MSVRNCRATDRWLVERLEPRHHCSHEDTHTHIPAHPARSKVHREILLATAITLAAISVLLMSRDQTEIASAPADDPAHAFSING